MTEFSQFWPEAWFDEQGATLHHVARVVRHHVRRAARVARTKVGSSIVVAGLSASVATAPAIAAHRYHFTSPQQALAFSHLAATEPFDAASLDAPGLLAANYFQDVVRPSMDRMAALIAERRAAAPGGDEDDFVFPEPLA